MSSNRSEQILDYAEQEMRKNGFDGVSFRDIATAIGIKSASVHYHYPTKADLSTAVTNRYAARFIEGLGCPDDPNETVQDRLTRLSDAYIDAYKTGASSCLCAVLGSVALHLPKSTSNEVRLFYTCLTDWVSTALIGSKARLDPALIIGMLQGAMVLSVALGQDKALQDAKAYIAGSVLS